MKTIRSRRDNAIVLVAGVGFFAALMIVGVSRLTMTMGGSKEILGSGRQAGGSRQCHC